MKKRKPKVWEWILVGVLILMYLFREELQSISGYLPPFLAFVLEFYSEEPGLWFGLLIGLCILQVTYANLSPEEQREADRRDTDERNVAIRGKAAWVGLNIAWIMLAIFTLVFAYWGSDREALFCAVGALGSIFSLPLLEHWYNKRM